MSDTPASTNQGAVRRIWSGIITAFAAMIRGINATGTFLRNVGTIFWAAVAVTSAVAGLMWFLEPLTEWLNRTIPQVTAEGESPPTASWPPTRIRPPTSVASSPSAPSCHADASPLYTILMAHAEKNPGRAWTLDSLLRATVWGHKRCFVAEVVEPVIRYRDGTHSVTLATTVWIGKEQVRVWLNADLAEEPPRLLRNAFVAVTGVLARMRRTGNGDLVLSLENSTFSEQWSKALEPRRIGPPTTQPEAG